MIYLNKNIYRDNCWRFDVCDYPDLTHAVPIEASC